MKTTLLALTTLSTSLLLSTHAFAHHSFAAEFDAEKKLNKHGVVTKVEWTNPHTYIYIEVPGATGGVEEWAFEMGSPNGLNKRGWTRETLGIGTDVMILGTQARDGSFKGNAQSVVLTDSCQRLFAGSSQRDFAEDEGSKVEGCTPKK